MNRESRAKKILDAYFAGKLDPRVECLVRGWLMKYHDAPENLEELRRQWIERIRVDKEELDEQALARLEELKRILGFPEDISPARIELRQVLAEEERTKRMSLIRRRVQRLSVAAVLVPALIVMGYWFLNDRASDDFSQPIIVHVSVPSTQGDLVSVPEGNKSIVLTENTPHRLPDQSTVRLGAGSTASLVENFGLGRKVELNGHATFDVTAARSENDHFTVQTQHFKITVLGTRFRVSSHAENDYSTIELYHGGIEVEAGGKSLKMLPRDHLSYDHNSRQMTVTRIPHTQLRYDDGMSDMVFNATPMGDVIKLLESKYGLIFTYDGKMPDNTTTLTGDFSAVTTLNEFIGMVRTISGRFDFEIRDEDIKVKIIDTP